MRFLIPLAILAFSAACGGGGGGSSSAVNALCKAQCGRADDCGFLDDADETVSQCVSECKSVQDIDDSSCKLTNAQVQACSAALTAQTCDEVDSSNIPDDCIVTCD